MNGMLKTLGWLLISSSTAVASDAKKPVQAPDPFVNAEKLLGLKKTKEATAVLDSIRLNPNDLRTPQYTFLKGLAIKQAGDEEGATVLFEKIYIRHSGSEYAARALIESIQIYKAKKNPAKVKELVSRLIETHPTNNAAIRFRVAEAEPLYSAKKFAEYAKTISPVAAMLKGPDLEKLKFAELMASGKADANSVARQAEAAFQQDNLAMAISLYEYAISTFPDCHQIDEIKTRLGWCFFSRAAEKDYERAEDLWRGVAASQRRNEWVAEARWHLVQLNSGVKGKWQEAADMCLGIEKDFPGGFRAEQALFARAWLFWAFEKYDKALEAFNYLVEAFPEKASHPPILFYINDSKAKLEG